MEQQYILDKRTFNKVYHYLSMSVFWREENDNIVIKTTSRYAKEFLNNLLTKNKKS